MWCGKCCNSAAYPREVGRDNFPATSAAGRIWAGKVVRQTRVADLTYLKHCSVESAVTILLQKENGLSHAAARNRVQPDVSKE
jgi:hypothetical protein